MPLEPIVTISIETKDFVLSQTFTQREASAFNFNIGASANVLLKSVLDQQRVRDRNRLLGYL